MRRENPTLLLFSAFTAAFVVVFAARVVLARTEAEAIEGPPRHGPTLADFTAERRSREFGLGRLLDEGKWEAAAEEANALLAFDPASEVAREALERTRAEMRAAEALQGALRLLHEGKEEEAFVALRETPAGTEAATRARLEAEPLAERIAGRARGDCLGLIRAGRHERALQRCRLHLDLVCAEGAEPELVERLRWLERRLRLPLEERWHCPGGEQGAPDDAGIRAILRAWERGESGERAALRMEELARRGVEGAADYVEPLRRAEARLRDGMAALLEGELEKAWQALGRAGEAEEALLGAGRSLRFREAAQRFGRLVLERGLDLEARRRPREAHRILSLGAQLDPSNTAILRALWRLEDASTKAAP